MQAFTQSLRKTALDFGFSAIGITTPNAIPQAAAQLRAFLAANHHGQMGWMEDLGMRGEVGMDGEAGDEGRRWDGWRTWG